MKIQINGELEEFEHLDTCEEGIYNQNEKTQPIFSWLSLAIYKRTGDIYIVGEYQSGLNKNGATHFISYAS